MGNTIIINFEEFIRRRAVNKLDISGSAEIVGGASACSALDS